MNSTGSNTGRAPPAPDAPHTLDPASTAPPPAAPPPPSAPSPRSAAGSPVPPTRERWVRSSGATRLDAVLAERWGAQGSTKVTGNVDADAIEVRGPLSIGGSLRAGSFRVQGPLDVTGPARTDGRAEIRGPARFEQSFESAELDVEGSIGVSGKFIVQGLARVTGEIRASSEARFGRLVGQGGLDALPGITAESVVFQVDRDSRIGTLHAGSVVITRPSAPPFKLPFIGKERPTLTVLRIEASEVHLDGVSVEVLQADRIVLGRNCHVARAIGQVLSVDPTSHVGPESRSPPPHGIHR